MSQGLKNAAGRGLSNITLTAAQKALLTEGDIEGLLELHHSQFGSATMADDDEDDDDDEDEEDDEDESDEDESEDDEDEDDEDEESGDDKAKKKAKLDPKDERIKELSGEAKKYRLKNREHRNRIAELERELAKAKPKAKPKAKADGNEDEDDTPAADPEVERKLERAQRALEDAAIRTEFLSNTTFAWKNPKAALRLLDLSDVEVDEDGEVLGLDEAIEQLAKDEPYLLKEKADARPQTKKRKPTGQPSGGRRKSGNANRDALLSKYPALRR